MINFDNSKKARINFQIKAKEVRLIDADGSQAGIVSITEALRRASDTGLDLVEISPTAAPPVCRVMDYGKYLFEQSKKHKNKAKQVQVKEVKLRPVTEVGDYMVKVRRAISFLQDGDKVKFIVRFRGREMDHQEFGVEILRRAENDLREFGVVEQQPRVEGRQMVMLVVPIKSQRK